MKDYGFYYNIVDFPHRVIESKRMREKYPDRYPIIVYKGNNCSLPDIDKHKFLVPCDLTIGQLVTVIRKRIKLRSDETIFIFINNVLPPIAASLTNIYEEHKRDDGFIYISYNGESTFG
tara:strand:- start:175 stop:531 length:357 start_codon:yes stop_codon:yes gene_type:complete